MFFYTNFFMKNSVFRLSISNGEFQLNPFNVKPEPFIMSEMKILDKRKKELQRQLKLLNKIRK